MPKSKANTGKEPIGLNRDVLPEDDVSALSYEQAFERLESIVDRMSSAAVPLDELMLLYEQGMALGAHCEKLLDSYDARLERVSRQALVKELDALDEQYDESAEEDGF